MTTKRFPRGGKYEGGCWHLLHISLLVVCSSSSKNNLFAFVLSSVAIMESQSPRPMPKLSTGGECRRFLALMGSDDPDAGYFQKMKNKKISRARMMREIAEELTAEGILVTQANCDNKWKALLTSHRTASKSGNDPKKDPPFHAEKAKILGDRASTRPKALAGSNIPVPKCSAPLSVSLDSSNSSSTPTTPTMISFPGKRKRDGLEENIDNEVDADFADDNDAAAPNLPKPAKKNKSSSKSRTNEVTTFLKKFMAD